MMLLEVDAAGKQLRQAVEVPKIARKLAGGAKTS
jgi:hypothetical protein